MLLSEALCGFFHWNPFAALSLRHASPYGGQRLHSYQTVE
jgi:hypothetical protein